MNIKRIEKAIRKAQSRISEKKLKVLGAWVCGKKAYYKIFSKSKDYTEAQETRIAELERICESCGLELIVHHFIDDLGDEFEETE